MFRAVRTIRSQVIGAFLPSVIWKMTVPLIRIFVIAVHSRFKTRAQEELSLGRQVGSADWPAHGAIAVTGIKVSSKKVPRSQNWH